MSNNDSGFVVTWPGNIFKTGNGSLFWTFDTLIGGYSDYPGTGSIQFMNDTAGIIAAGQYGTYARTFDRANTWQVSHIDSGMFIVSIYMRNLNVGYAVGYDGKFSRTFDGGLTWTAPAVISQYHLNDIAFFNDSVGYIVGGNGTFPFDDSTKGIILKTNDGGNSWFVEDSSYDAWLTAVVAVNNSVGYAAGWNGRILKITNGGASGIEPNIPPVSNFNVFPNPTPGNFTITFPEKINNAVIEIYNMFGERIYKENAGNVRSIMLNPDLSAGVYFLKAFADSKNFVAKIVIY